MLTRNIAVKLTAASASECLFVDFLSEIEPKKVKIAIGSKWVFENKKDKHRIITKNKARLVAQGYSQEERIDYDETFAPVVRMNAIMIFLVYATYMNFIVFQMDVKSAFLNGKIKEVYIKHPPDFESSEFPDYVCKLDKALYRLKQAPKGLCGDLTVESLVFHNNNVVGNFSYPQSTPAYKEICKFLMNCPLAEAFTRTSSVVYQNFLKEFWCTTIVYDLNPPTNDFEVRPLKEFKFQFSVMNGKKLLTIDFKTFTESTGINYYDGTYVSHPSPEAVKAELAKIIINLVLLDMTPVLKNCFSCDLEDLVYLYNSSPRYDTRPENCFPVAWRILFTFGIQVLGGNYSSTEQTNSIQQLLAYCLLTGIKVDILKIIYSDLVTSITNKSRKKYVSYPRFIACTLEVLLGTSYTQNENFRIPPTILSNSNFYKNPSKVTPIELTASMIVVNNHGTLVSPLPFIVKKKKKKPQTVTPTLPKS
ncbi:retrovirus-related pol polyprotein from transposon TNT 1-94 [Tanacetum coccineum]